MEGGVGGGEHGDAPARGKAHGQVAVPPLRQVVDPLVGVPLDPQYLLGVLYIDLTRLCQVPVGPGAVEEGCAQFLLQLKELLVQGRLGDVELVRRPGDVIFFRDL